MTDGFELSPRLAEDSCYVDRMDLCELRLVNDSRYPWFLLIPHRANVTELFQLSVEDEAVLWRESRRLQQTLMEVFVPDSLNIAAIGNLVSQLHVHHVVRFRDDAAWPAPVWGRGTAQPYTDSARKMLLDRVRPVWRKWA